jgi:hypothetical protein
MVRSEENRNLRPPSCCSVDVMNGGYGRRVYGFSSTEATFSWTPCNAVASAVAVVSSSTVTSLALRSTPSESKSRPVATRSPSTVVSLAVKVGGAAFGSETLASSLATMSQ